MKAEISPGRLMARIAALGRIGALEGGGVCRLALSDADKAGRDWLVAEMEALGLTVFIDAIGNIWGLRAGRGAGAPVMIGSHIDTVATGGLYDGALGVLAGLEVVAALDGAGIETAMPIAVAAFTNEEGARFAPDMMGSGVYQGALDLDAMLATRATDGGGVVGEALDRIGYRGTDAPITPAAYLELHIEQGPVLEQEGTRIGAVTGVQGIHWTEFTVHGQSNHAGTTPMALRRDAGQVAMRIALAADRIAAELGPPQVATVGVFELSPGLINVVPEQARLTVDLRNTDGAALDAATARLLAEAGAAAEAAGCTVEHRALARFAPVVFDEALVGKVAQAAAARQLSVKRMPSGAGHDAQMFAPDCPTAMIFIPSEKGLSHNIKEHSDKRDIVAGAQVLLDLVCDLAGAKT
ncbi:MULTISPECIES: M20 family metallo-hydrolase [Actibacterium]|uniref:N-carbamoyl-L-amino-acid hydrolase n=1 Tax=Actibacterium naphthalenivorans TaxID=1614693 RepID=A0A840C7S8_9RHOB|nr:MULTISPECIES: M20 family metallo-hydrolase [Actibacterium]ALG90126.1 allantoate amidohydrolase [Actibacterium sp. EMB200-NS6]MBB4022001.1 N-carbamoyl-L-amino-acid hydrolase [Actibacterium naphthalenivorans]